MARIHGRDTADQLVSAVCVSRREHRKHSTIIKIALTSGSMDSNAHHQQGEIRLALISLKSKVLCKLITLYKVFWQISGACHYPQKNPYPELI